MHHAIIINKQFSDESYPTKFKTFAKKTDGDWEIYGVEVEDLKSFISEVQQNMKSGTWYAHAYNYDELVVIFKDKVFNTKPDKSTWQEILKYGKSLNIPEVQLDFQPNKFEEEQGYFSN